MLGHLHLRRAIAVLVLLAIVAVVVVGVLERRREVHEGVPPVGRCGVLVELSASIRAFRSCHAAKPAVVRSVPPILKIEVETPSSEGEGLCVGVKLARAGAHGAATAQARCRRERAELGVEELQVLEDCAASSLLGRGFGWLRVHV